MTNLYSSGTHLFRRSLCQLSGERLLRETPFSTFQLLGFAAPCLTSQGRPRYTSLDGRSTRQHSDVGARLWLARVISITEAAIVLCDLRTWL